jgi:hypothetical protein
MDEGMAAPEAEGFLTRPAAVLVAFGGEGTAGFQTGCIADVPIGGARKSGARSSGGRRAGLETRDTADLEVCGTTTGQSDSFFTWQCQDVRGSKRIGERRKSGSFGEQPGRVSPVA